MNIKTEKICPPVPSNQFDWAAWIDGDEERGCGFGPTEQDAITSLKDKLLLEVKPLPPLCFMISAGNIEPNHQIWSPSTPKPTERFVLPDLRRDKQRDLFWRAINDLRPDCSSYPQWGKAF